MGGTAAKPIIEAPRSFLMKWAIPAKNQETEQDAACIQCRALADQTTLAFVIEHNDPTTATVDNVDNYDAKVYRSQTDLEPI